MKKVILIGFWALANQSLAAVPNLTCETLNQSFNNCPGKSDLTLSISDHDKYPGSKLVTFEYDIEAKPQCYQARPTKGTLTGRVYFQNHGTKGFVIFSEEEQQAFSDETSDSSGLPTWESSMLTGRNSQQYISVNVLNENNAEVELRSYYGVTINQDKDVVPAEESRLRRVLKCQINN